MIHPRISVGDSLPKATLCCLVNDKLEPVEVKELVAGRTIMFVGMPGAFTPTCSRHHVPSLIDSVPQIQRHGIEHIYVISSNDPWVMRAWQESCGSPVGVTFISDGNYEFLTRCGLIKNGESLFLGQRSARFMMVCKDGKVTRLTVEPNLVDLTCTTAQTALSG